MQEGTGQQHRPPASGTPPDRALKDAEQLINVFLLAWNNYGLYPEGHATSAKSLASLASAFDLYLSANEDLFLSIEKNRVLFDNEPLHEIPPHSTSEDFFSLLYRDGIQQVSFSQGITREELTQFFRIVSKYKMLVEETEGDIVTSLVDADLENISFKAVDIFFEDLPLIEFSELNKSVDAEEEEEYQVEEEEPQDAGRHKDSFIKSIADPAISDSLWEITPEEHQKLLQMVREEENWDNTEDVFDVLLVILRSQKDRENFTSVLSFTREEVIETIEQGEFRLLLKLFQALHQFLYQKGPDDSPWTQQLIKKFFHDLSGPDTFRLIADKLVRMHDSDSEEIKALRQLLLYFSPDIMLNLGPVILQSKSPAIKKMLTEVLEYLCHRDINPLEEILDNPDRELGEKLIFLAILTRLKDERVNKILYKLSHDSTGKLRSGAVKALLARDPAYAQKLFSLIDDPDKATRTSILGAITQQRSTMVENMLLKKMKEGMAKKDPDHILACYEALGRCGSENSIPFLRRTLLEKGLSGFFGGGKSIHREGAAIALALIDSWDAKDILLEASQSKFKTARNAAHWALTQTETSGESSDE